MGWATGARVLSDIIEAVDRHVLDDSDKMSLYKDLIIIFEEYDCDNTDECLEIDSMFDEVYYELKGEEEVLEEEE
jgi:hypothetical protein